MKSICIDTGVLINYFSKDRTDVVKALMDEIMNKKAQAHVLKPALIEVFYHICKDGGLQEANTLVLNFMRNYPINFVDLDETLILYSGKLKCQHPSSLSYIDCMSIAFCLKNGVEFHTTEKLLKQIPHNMLGKLRIVKYEW